MSGPFGSSQWMYASGAASFYDYEIGNSCRFENAMFTQTLNGNRRTFTMSFWYKRTGTGEQEIIQSNASSGLVLASDQFEFSNYVSSYQIRLRPAPKIRDLGAWYHIVVRVDTTQGTASDRVKMYYNGVLQDSFTYSTYPTQNYELIFNNNTSHRIGRNISDGQPVEGYLANFELTDGVSNAPSAFGETKNDIWIPKEYTGSYGTSGFKLFFQDSSAMGDDTSGNTNDWSISSSTIAASDQVLDSPTNNFPVQMRTDASGSITMNEGGLQSQVASSGNYMSAGTSIGMKGGKYYFEYRPIRGGNNSDGLPDIRLYPDGTSALSSSSDPTGSIALSLGTRDGSDGVYMVALDLDNGKVYRGRNGSWSNSGDPTSGATGTGAVTTLSADNLTSHLRVGVTHRYDTGTSIVTFNFGQEGTFLGYTTAGGNADENGFGNFKYAPPSGYLAICTRNLPDPAAAIDPNQSGSPQDYFNSTLYTGTGSLLAVTTGFQPDWTWIKERNGTDQHIVQDSVRGNFILYPDSTQAEGATGGGWVTETSTGFTADANGPINTSGDSYVAWNWKAGTAFSNDASATGVGSIDSSGTVNTDVGFSIISWTAVASSATQTIAHGLGAVPQMIIMKNRDRSVNWAVYHLDIGNSHGLELNTNAAGASDSGWWNNTTPTSTVFTTGNGNGYRTGGIAENYIAYCFAEVDGYSKIGSYTGNSNADGTFVYTGFKTAWLMFKKENSADDWAIHDSKRVDYGTNSNPIDDYLKPNSTAAEGDDGPSIDFLSNGFKWRINSGMRNNSGDTYIYMAFAEQPFKYANAR